MCIVNWLCEVGSNKECVIEIANGFIQFQQISTKYLYLKEEGMQYVIFRLPNPFHKMYRRKKERLLSSLELVFSLVTVNNFLK